MNKVEIEILQYESKQFSYTTTGQLVANGDFNSAMGVAYTLGTSDIGSFGSGNGIPADAMQTENPIISNWKGYRSANEVGAVNFGTPCYINGSNQLVIPNEPIAVDPNGNAWPFPGSGNVTVSGVYQTLQGFTAGQTYNLEIDIAQLPGGANANDMNGIYFRIGMWGNNPYSSSGAGQVSNSWGTSFGVVSGFQVNDVSSPNTNTSPVVNCIEFDYFTPLTLGVNTIPFVFWNNPPQTDGVLCISVYGNTSLGGYGFQETIINSVHINSTTTTTTTSIDALGSTLGRLDLTDSQNFPLAMTYAVADGTNFESIFGDHSKTFQVPATKQNQKLLGHIQNEKIVDNKKITIFKECRILVEGLEVTRGKLKVTGASQKKKPEFFDCVFYSGNADWGAQIKDKRMCDLQLALGDGQGGAGQITFSFGNIQNSWTMNQTTSDIVYPLVSYGEFYPLGDDGVINLWDSVVASHDFRGWFYVYNLLKYIFENAGFTISSNFFDSNGGWFKKLICYMGWGFNDNATLSDAAGLHYESLPTVDPPVTFLDNVNFMVVNNLGSGGAYYDSGWEPIGTTPTKPGIQYRNRIHDAFGQYSEDDYTGGATGEIIIANFGKAKVHFKFHYLVGSYWNNGGWAQSGGHYFWITGRIRSNIGGVLATVASSSSSPVNAGGQSPANQYYVWRTLECSSNWVNVIPGQKIWCEVRMEGQPIGGGVSNNSAKWSGAVMDNKSSTYGHVKMEFDMKDIQIGQTFDANRTLPCNLKQTDFIKAIAHMYNLYFYTDSTSKTVYIEPFSDFYLPTQQGIDWTNKIDWSKSLVDKFETGLKNELLFQYKDDSNDKWIEWKRKLIGLTYPFYSWYTNLTNQGNPGLKKLQNPVFSGTMQEYDPDTKGNNEANLPNLIPVMERQITVFGINASSTTERPEKGHFNYRILYYDGYTTDGDSQVNRWTYQTGATTFNTSQTYPRSIMVDVTQTSTAFKDRINLSFNDELHTDGSTMPGLVNLYWVDMLAQLAASPRVRTLYVNLKITDILKLNFTKLIYLDGSYWRLLKVHEFAPAKNETTKIEVVQWINIERPSELNVTV